MFHRLYILFKIYNNVACKQRIRCDLTAKIRYNLCLNTCVIVAPRQYKTNKFENLMTIWGLRVVLISVGTESTIRSLCQLEILVRVAKNVDQTRHIQE